MTHWWSDPQTGRERMLKYHVVHYFVPEDDAVTRIVTFAFLKIHWPLVSRLGPRVGWLLRRRISQTVQEDAYLVEHLADQSTSLTGMRLSRFDAILGLTRARLQRIYDGKRNEERRTKNEELERGNGGTWNMPITGETSKSQLRFRSSFVVRRSVVLVLRSSFFVLRSVGRAVGRTAGRLPGRRRRAAEV